jgi:hypothetical protein
LKKKQPVTFAALGHINIERHLRDVHSLEDPTGRRKRKHSTASLGEPPDKQQRIDTAFKLNARFPQDQALINALKFAFDRDYFQKLLINWIVESNLPFRTIEHPRLRELLMYLNPLVRDTNALITHPTARRMLVNEYNRHREAVVHLLRSSPGFIHIAFDGWSSRNKHSLYGITCSFLDQHFRVQKIVLGLPELQVRHTGENIATEVIEILSSYRIEDKVGYFTLDNGSNNDTAMEAIADHFGFEGGRQRQVRCIGHIINLVVKAFLFGKNHQVFEDETPAVQALEVATHRLWQKTGPVGKLHNLVTWINRSDSLTQALLKLQRDYNEDNPSGRIKVLRLVSNSATRWLSQFYMIERALKLRNFIEDLWDDQVKVYKRSGRSGNDLPLCLQPDAQLTASDWSLLEQMYKLLGKFNVVLRVLEGDGQTRERLDGSLRAYGLIWHVVFAFEFMLETLEEAKHQLADEDHLDHWRIAVDCAWGQLDKYYQRLDDCPVYYAAVALHPAFRWRYFETKWVDCPDWITSAKSKVKDLWESGYQKRPISDNMTTLRLSKTKASFVNPFHRYSDPSRFSSPFVSDLDSLPDDEYERWQQLTDATDTEVENPLEYWYTKKYEYPRLAQMAVEILSIPAMSAECERLFSSGGLMVTPLRSQLEASTIGLAQTLRSWLKAGIIEDSVMDVVDFDDENQCDGSLDVVKSCFNEGLEGRGESLKRSLEDGDQVHMMDD